MKTPSKIKFAIMIVVALACTPAARAQTAVPAIPLVPLGDCQIGSSALGSATPLSKCVRASFTASAGTPANQLVVTSVAGIILPGDQIITGTGATAGTVIVSQISGTPGGAGTYLLSATNTTSSASVTTGGIPPGATMAFLQAEVADIRYRDDGGAPTTAIGNLVVHGIPGIFYAGTLAQLQFIGASGSPLLDIAFYR